MRIRFCFPSKVKDLLGSEVLTSIVSEQVSNKKQLLNTTEAALFLGISKNTLYDWVNQRKIPFIKIGRLTKFRQKDLESWLEQRSSKEEKNGYRD